MTPYHLEYGADLVWQIGTAYFGCRTEDGRFDLDEFREKATRDEVKAIEVKLSRGAKPGHGGILPADKVSEEIAEFRGVPSDEDVVSPPTHREFSTPIEMLKFLDELRELSNGKPVGFKFCVGHPTEMIWFPHLSGLGTRSRRVQCGPRDDARRRMHPGASMQQKQLPDGGHESQTRAVFGYRRRR